MSSIAKGYVSIAIIAAASLLAATAARAANDDRIHAPGKDVQLISFASSTTSVAPATVAGGNIASAALLARFAAHFDAQQDVLINRVLDKAAADIAARSQDLGPDLAPDLVGATRSND